MKTRFVAYNRLGAKRGVLTHIMQAEVVPSKNELPTLTLTYPRAQPTHKWLLNSPEVAFEYFHNNKWVEPKNARFKLVTQDFDYLEEVETRNYSFIGIGEAIRGIYVFGPNGRPRNDEGKVQFENATPGEMLSHVWDYAVKRGWKGFTRSFSATRDSAPLGDGQAWRNRLSLSFADDTSLEGMLMYFSRMGLIDFAWEGRTLHVYNADTSMQRDLSTGNNPMKFNLSGGRASVDSAPESNDHENLATHVVVTGEEGLRWVFPTGITLPEGRREVFLSYSGVDDEGTAQILAAPTIAKYSNSLKNTTRQFQIGPSTISFPFIDYGIGDWVLVEKDDANWERVQIFQLALLINQSGVQGYVSLGDKIDSLLEKLNEAVQRVQGGSVNEGTEPPADSLLAPSPPTGVVATARTIYTLKGEARAVIGVNFAHNGLDVNGDPIAIDTYRVMYRKKGTNGEQWGWHLMLTIPAPTMAGTHSYLDITDHTGALLTYEVRVIAVSNKGKESQPSVHANVEMKYDATAPQKPAKPSIKVSLAVFEVTTNHRTATGALQDVDYAHTIVEMSTTATGPWVERSNIVPPMKTAYIGGEGYNTRWFRIIAVDWEGNRSEPSEVISAKATPLVDGDVILTEIDAARTQIKNADQAILASGATLAQKLAASDKALADTNTSLTGPGGLTERLTGAENKLKDVGALTYATGQTLRQKLTESDKVINDTKTSLNDLKTVTLPSLSTDLADAELRLDTAQADIVKANTAIDTANGEITKVANRVSPIESGLNTLNKTTIPGLQLSIDGKTGTIRKTVAPTAADTADPGTRWEVWTSLNPGGKLTQTWRRTQAGTAWIQDLLSPDYIPLIDIGQGTFGSLSGGRLIAKSVSANHLLIGFGENLLADPSFEDPEVSARRVSSSPAWSWVQDVLGGSYITASTMGDLQLGNASNSEMFPIDPKGALSFTVDAEGPDLLQVYLQVKYADGTVNTGPYLRDLKIGGGRTTVTAQWDFAGPTQSSTGSPPVSARPILRRKTDTATLTGANKVYSVRFAPATKGELIVNGTITGDHVAAESVAAKIGQFVKADIGNLIVTGSSKLTDVVAKRVAADTASFQTVDAKNIFVTGTASLSDVVAKRFAADSGKFITLGVDQLTVTGTANMETAVADRMFTNIFATNRLTASQVLIGEGGNIFADPNFLDSTGWGNPWWIVAGGGRNGNNGLAIPATATQAGAYYGLSDRNRQFAVIPGASYKISVWVKPDAAVPIGGASIYMKYTTPASAVSGLFGTPGNVSNTEVLKAGVWAEIAGVIKLPDTATKAFLGVFTQSSTNVRVVFSEPGAVQAVDQGLIVDNGIIARHITASEEMSAKIGKFLKVELVDLVATGTANLNTAVIENLWNNVVRSRSITTDMLLVGKGANLIPNGDLANGKEGWADSFGLANPDPRAVEKGFPATIWVLGTNTYNSTASFPIKAGVNYRFSMWARGNVANKRFYVQLITDAGASPYLLSQVVTQTYLSQHVAEFEAPANATSAVLRIYANHANGATTEGHQWFTGFEMYEKNAASLIVTGGISTPHLNVTEDMTVALLKVHKVEAGEINFNSLFGDSGFIGDLRTNVLRTNSLTSDMIQADAITSKHTLTGPLIRSAVSGARTEMNNQGIRVLNSSNIELMRIGYGISTGIALRNPADGLMTAIAPVIFGPNTLVTSRDHIALKEDGQGQSWPNQYLMTSAGVRYYFTAVSESVILQWKANAVPFLRGEPNSGTTTDCFIHVGLAVQDTTVWSVRRSSAATRVSMNRSMTQAFNHGTFIDGWSVTTGLIPGNRYSIVIDPYCSISSVSQNSGGSKIVDINVTDIELSITPR